MEILIILFAILINAVFAMSEMAVAASRKARLQQRINEGDRRALTALKLIEHPNLFLATVQIGITLVGVFAGAVGGATLSEPLGQLLARFPALRDYANSLA
ncbi:MAG TPA: CNNM domain-containing protein, partial [Anaerolineales bacterium]|nr:CNNM domain-containing protein [Anaerolineales bacterium]